MVKDFIQNHLLKIWIFISIICGIIIGWVYFTFQVKNIILNKSENTINVRYGALLQMLEYVKNVNIVMLKTDSLENHFVHTFKELKSVHIEKQYPQTLVVTVEPLEIVAKWVYEYKEKDSHVLKNISLLSGSDRNVSEEKKVQKHETITKSGFLNKNNLFLEHNSVKSEENSKLLVIEDKQPREKEIKYYDIVKDGHYIPSIITAKKRLEEVIKRDIVKVEYYRDAEEVHFIDNKGVIYWLYLEEDLLDQISKLDYMLDRKNILRWRIDYIDLRIHGKVIYKFDE